MAIDRSGLDDGFARCNSKQRARWIQPKFLATHPTPSPLSGDGIDHPETANGDATLWQPRGFTSLGQIFASTCSYDPSSLKIYELSSKIDREQLRGYDDSPSALTPSYSRSLRPDGINTHTGRDEASAMPKTTAPRSVKDATRFTAATPHASSKPFDPRFGPSSKSTTPSSSILKGASNAPTFTETPEQRVARLRAAHRAAQQQASTFDKVIGGGRRFFDSAHKIFIIGIIGFTGNDTLFSYSTRRIPLRKSQL